MIDYFSSLIANCASEWRPVVGYEGLYEVSESGVVRSLDREVWEQRGRHKSRFLPGKTMRCSRSRDAYRYHTVSLCKMGKPKRFNVHCLMAAAFIGPRPIGHVVDHIDGDSTNNDISNLRYCTVAVNVGKQRTDSRPFLGTYFLKDKGRWLAQIQIDKKTIRIGSYHTREEALAARTAKEQELKGANAPIRMAV